MQRFVMRVGLVCVAVVTAAQVGLPPRANAGARSSCELLIQKVARRGVESATRCIARAKRQGSEHAAECVTWGMAKATTVLTRRDAACSSDPAAVIQAVERCVETIRAEIPGNGRCAGKKVASAGALLRRATRVGWDARASRSLCRSFEKAGSCAGDCDAVGSVLAACGRDLADLDPPEPMMPVPAADDEIVLFGAYEGEAVSTATIVGQDEETGTVRVVIEPGTSRLYVVLAGFEATIWRLEGATSRVGHVVLLGAHSQGVTGVAAQIVTDMTKSTGELASAFFYDTQSPDGVAIRGAVERALGRPVDVFGGDYAVGTLSLPSAAVEHASPEFGTAPPGYDPGVYFFATIFNPGGIVDVDPADVVPAGAEAYVVLPQWFGLAQLVASGALTNQGGPFGGYFYIAAPIARFPAGLAGAQAVSFVLGRGVPMPPGDPGHSCVISEETGLPLVDSWLCFMSQPPDSTCELPAAVPDDQIVLFGAYEGEAISTASVVGQDEETDTARVVVEAGTTPLYVVLSSFNATIWRFEGATERVRHVVLVGVRQQGVTGLAADIVVDRTELAGSLTQARCFAPFYGVQSPEGVAARGVVERALGRAVDAFGASYGVGTLSLPGATVEEATPTPSGVPAGFDPEFYDVALRFNPGGFVDIAPADVVPGGAEAYEILPHQFGLAQLIGAGAIENVGSYFFGPLLIKEPIVRFPAGLFGAHAAVFVLGHGVPLPPGDPGHSCVVSEDTGLPIVDGPLCGIGDLLMPPDGA